MPHLCVISPSVAQRRQLGEYISFYSQKGYSLSARFDAKEGMRGSPDNREISWSYVFAMSRSGGLFAEKQLFVIESAESLSEFPSELERFLEAADEADSVVICVYANEGKFSTSKIFPSSAQDKIEFVMKEEAVPPWKRKDWIIRFSKDLGVSIASDAASVLAESIDEQEELRGELTKLADYAKPRQISLELVKQLSFDEGGSALLKFLDGFSLGKAEDVISSLKYLRQDTSPLPTITALSNRLRPALYITLFKDEKAALATLGTRDYAARMAKGALNIYGKAAIQGFMLELVRLSFMEKTNNAEGWAGFEAALLMLLRHSSSSPHFG